jgi:hypothetical protein
MEMNIDPRKEKPIAGTVRAGRRFRRVDPASSHKEKKEAHSIKQKTQPEGRPPQSLIRGQSNTPDSRIPDYTARFAVSDYPTLQELVDKSFQIKKSSWTSFWH